MFDFDNDSVTLDIYKKDNPVCPICAIRLVKDKDDTSKWNCTNCLRVYLPNMEVMNYEDDMVSVHEDEQPELAGIGGDGGGLLVEGDDDIMQPKYGEPKLKLKPGEHLVSYEEENPDPE